MPEAGWLIGFLTIGAVIGILLAETIRLLKNWKNL